MRAMTDGDDKSDEEKRERPDIKIQRALTDSKPSNSNDN